MERAKPDFKTIGSPRPCKRCEGKGEKWSDYAHFNPGTKEFTGGLKKCDYCQGRGNFPPLDIKAILDGVTTTRGGKRFRKSMTSPLLKDGPLACRVYYVWRMARFHGGADVTMPMAAMDCTRGEPFEAELEVIADVVARKVFGTHFAAATRWGRALGYEVPETPNLPPSAQSGGPVHDGNDPITVELEKYGLI